MSKKEMHLFLERMAEKVKAKNNFVVVGHHDCDGICSTAIIFRALERLGKKAATHTIKQLYSDSVQELKELGENFIFVDFGSGQLEFLVKEFNDNFFVFDHHEPSKIAHENHFNAMNFGFNGGTDLCGAGSCYLFAKTLDEKNIDLVQLAIVGAIGDMQDFSSGKLIGLNAEILIEAEKNGFVKVENDLRLYGRISRPLIQFLLFSTNPILPALTGNEDNCIKFLQGLGIELKKHERFVSYNELSFEDKRKLSTALILHLQSFNVPEWKIKELIGEVYTFPKEGFHSPLRDAKEFSTLNNSCGRHGMGEVALKVCLGDRGEHYLKAIALMQDHRRQLREGIEFISKILEEREEFYFFDAEDKVKDTLVGIIAGMLYGSVIESSKPVIAFGRYDEKFIKVSARATKELVRRGLNLGKTLKEICKELGESSEGGGHSIAAGCRINVSQREEFLLKLNEKIKESLSLKETAV